MSVIYYLLLIDLTKTSFPPTLSYPLTMSPAWKWTVELHSVYNTLSLPLLHGHSLLYVAPSHGTLSFLSWSCVGFPQDKGLWALLQHSSVLGGHPSGTAPAQPPDSSSLRHPTNANRMRSSEDIMYVPFWLLLCLFQPHQEKKKKKRWMKLVMFPQKPWKIEISVRVEENYQNHQKKNKQKTIVQIIQPWALPETSVVPSSWDKQAFICVFSISLGISLGILATAVKSWSIYRLAHSVLTKSNILLKAIKIISELKHSLDHGW